MFMVLISIWQDGRLSIRGAEDIQGSILVGSALTLGIMDRLAQVGIGDIKDVPEPDFSDYLKSLLSCFSIK